MAKATLLKQDNLNQTEETTLPATQEAGQATLPAMPESVNDIYALARAQHADMGEEARAMVEQSQKAVSGGLPFASIRQKGGPGTEIGGLKFNDGRPDIALPIKCIVITAQAAQVCWTEGDMAAPPRCKSVDGIHRLPDVPDPGKSPDGKCAGLCAECIRRLWTNDRLLLAEKYGAWIMEGANEDKPECSEVMNLFVVPADLSDAFALSLHGTSLKPTGNYLNRMKRRKIPFFALLSELSTTYQRTPKGDFYVSEWKEAGLTPRALTDKIYEELSDSIALLSSRAESFDSVFDRDWTPKPEGYSDAFSEQ